MNANGPKLIQAAASYILGMYALIAQWNQPPYTEGEPKLAFWVALAVGLIMSAVSIVISELLKPNPKIQNAKPAGEGDFKFPTSDETRPVPLIWGRVKLSGPNVIWWGDLRQVPIRESIKTGLLSKKRIVTGFRYFVGIDMAFCRGGKAPVTLHQVFIGKKPVTISGGTLINEPNLLGGSEFGSGGIVGNVEFFPGTETQIRSTYLRRFQDPMSAQRGTAHLVFEGGWIGNNEQIKPWAAECSRFPSELLDIATSAGKNGDYSAGENIILSNDLNLMEAAYEVITDGDWGMGRLPSKVDLVSFSAVAATLHTEGNGFSMQLERVTNAREFLNLLQEQMDGVIYFDKRTGKYKAELARQDYVVSSTITSITGGNTYNVVADGLTYDVGSILFAEDNDTQQNNGRKTVTSRTATSVTVSEALVNETPSGVAFVSSLNGINKSNRVTVKSFSRQTWDGMTNQVRIGFTDRARNYFNTFARSDSLANQRMQKGETITSSIQYPGVKRAALANDFAARDLRFLSFPLAKATIVVNRNFWDAHAGQVLRWTDENLGFNDLAMRITRIDFGTLEKPDITLLLLQDVFALEAGFFGAPPVPLWTQPVQEVVPIPINEHQVFEAPKKIVDLDLLSPRVADRVFVGLRAQAGETAIKIYQRNDIIAPVGAYGVDGKNEGMFLIGTLNVALSSGDANPTPTIQIDGTPDAKARIELDSDPDGATVAEIGQRLANMIKIGNEFIAARDLVDAGGNLLNFTTAYRGLLDSVSASHDVGAFVYLLYVSGGLNDTAIPPGNFVDIQPRTVSRDQELTEGNSKTFSFQMNNRYRSPYPPSAIEVDTVRFPSAPDLDGTITNPGGDTEGVDLEWLRRDWENVDEVAALADDAEILEPGFQAKHDHESLLNAFVRDADGLRIQVGIPNTTFINGNTGVAARSDIVSMTDGEPPTGYLPSVQVRHTVDAVVYQAISLAEYESAPTSAFLAALTNLGTVFANGPISRTYTTTAAVTHDLTVGTAITGVQFRLNEGAWTAIASLSGETIAIGDELEFRHGDTSESPMNTMAVLDENGTDRAYVIFNTSTEFEGFVGYWNLNESSTGVAQVDRLSRFGGAPTFVDVNTCESGTGQFGNAVRCTDGVSDVTVEHLSISNVDASRKNLAPAGTEQFTIMCWVRLPVGGAIAKGVQTIWGIADFDSASPFSDRSVYFFYDDGSGFRMVFISTGAPEEHNGVATFGGTDNVNDEDKWIHCSMVISSAAGGTITIYVKDGTTTPTPTYLNQTGLGTVQTSTEPLNLGAGQRSGSPAQNVSPEDILIDDFRIYKGRALSESEIDAIVAATQPLE